MVLQDRNPHSNVVQKGFLLGVLLGLILVLVSRIIVPATNFLSIAGAVLILVIYGLVGYFVFPRIRPEILTSIGVFGLLAGIIFVSEILLEYAILPKDNTRWGTIEFGGVFLLYFMSALCVAYRYNGIKNGILAAVTTAMIGSAIWLIFVLLTFYLFRGTIRQELVFTAEGNFEDFARSGMTDFNTFVMEDFLGAAFFHLLLVPLIAAILGTIGSLLGKGIAHLTKH